MSETLKYRQELREKLEAEFGDSGVKTDESQSRSLRRVVLPILGGAGPDEYDFSPNEYLLRRWQRERMEKHTSPVFRKRLKEMQQRYL